MPSPIMSPDPATRALPRVPDLLLGQLRHHLRQLLRTPRAVSTGMVLPVLLLLLAGTTRGHLPVSRLAGYATLGLTMTTWTAHGIGLVAAREAGVLKRWRAAPLPTWCHLAGRVAASMLVGVMAATITVLTGVLLFATHLGPAQAAVVVAALTLGALTCAACTTAVTGFIPTVASAFPILGLTYLPVVLISGVFGPLPTEPHWLTTLAGYLPVQPIVDATQHAIRDAALPTRDLLILAAWTLASALTARASFRWQPTKPRRRRAFATRKGSHDERHSWCRASRPTARRSA